MTFIYYVIFFFAGLYIETDAIADPKSVAKMTQHKASNPDYAIDYKFIDFCMLIYSLFSFIGLFSSQWLLFIPLIILGFIPRKWKVWVFIDALISLILIVFIILNKYHLHYKL